MNTLKATFVAAVILATSWVAGQTPDQTDQTPPAPPPTTSTTTPPTTTPPATTTPDPDPDLVLDGPDMTALSSDDQTTVEDALQVIADHDPDRLDDMLEVEWEVGPCVAECAAKDALAQTEVYSCVTSLDLDAIATEADSDLIPRSYWLATTLVHERAHCDVEGMEDEFHSLASEREFVNTWEEPQRGYAIEALDQFDTQLDANGNWDQS